MLLTKSTIRIFAWAYTAAILLLVTLPINGEDQLLGDLNNTYVMTVRLDYFSHVLLFVPWVLLVVKGFGLVGSGRRRWGTALALMVLFATLAEYVQWLLPYRTFNINDLAANVLGLMLGIPFAFSVNRYFDRLLSTNHKAE